MPSQAIALASVNPDLHRYMASLEAWPDHNDLTKKARHFADDISKCIFSDSNFTEVYIGSGNRAEQAISHYLSQCWPCFIIPVQPGHSESIQLFDWWSINQSSIIPAVVTHLIDNIFSLYNHFFFIQHQESFALNQGIFRECEISDLNPLRAKFFRGNINIYLHFVSFLYIDTTQVV